MLYTALQSHTHTEHHNTFIASVSGDKGNNQYEHNCVRTNDYLQLFVDTKLNRKTDQAITVIAVIGKI